MTLIDKYETPPDLVEADDGPVERLRAYLKARDACDYDHDELDYLVGETVEDVARLLASDIRALLALATAQAAQIADLTEGQARAEQEERIRTRQLADETIRAEAAEAKVAELEAQSEVLHSALSEASKTIVDAKAEAATLRVEVERLREGCPQPCMCPSCWEGKA